MKRIIKSDPPPPPPPPRKNEKKEQPVRFEPKKFLSSLVILLATT